VKKWIVLTAGFLSLASSTVAAQSIGSHPASERGRRSIALGVGGATQVGFWTRSSDRTDLGLELSGNGFFSDRNTTLLLTLTPSLKRYHGAAGPLAPYTFFGVPLQYQRSANDNVGAPDTAQDSYGVGGAAGFGLDWFPVPQVSLGGHVGLQAIFHQFPDDSNVLSVNTLSSGIRAHLYF
jgi:hypothetical protein